MGGKEMIKKQKKGAKPGEDWYGKGREMRGTNSGRCTIYVQ